MPDPRSPGHRVFKADPLEEVVARSRSHPLPSTLSELAEEFRLLDLRRRERGLSLTDAGRYYALFARLSDVLDQSERHRRADVRQFLRIRFELDLLVHVAGHTVHVACLDFGGGGCAVTCESQLQLDEELRLEGALVAAERHPLTGRAVVVWERLPSKAGQHSYGLRFVLDDRRARDQIDRLFYRVLALFLGSSHTSSWGRPPPPARPERSQSLPSPHARAT